MTLYGRVHLIFKRSLPRAPGGIRGSPEVRNTEFGPGEDFYRLFWTLSDPVSAAKGSRTWLPDFGK